MKVILQLMGVVVLLAAIAPVAMAGGRMIGAFMMGRQILQWTGITLLTMVVLVVAGMLAMHVGMPGLTASGSDFLAIVASALVLLVPTWGVWLLGKKWMDQVSKTP